MRFPTMLALSVPSFVVSLLALLVGACSGATPASPTSTRTSDVTCPAGQKFDGAYCVEDASAPAPPPASPPASASSISAAPAPAGSAAPASSAALPPPPASSVAPGPVSAAPTSNAQPVPTSPTIEKSPATSIDVSMAVGAAPLIQYLASAHIPAGAKPFGAPFAGQFRQSQVLEQRVKLTPGKCYTVVAASVPPLTSLGVQIVSAADGTLLLGESEGGAQVAVGRKKACFVPGETQSDVRIVVIAEQGNGVAAAQLFEK